MSETTAPDAAPLAPPAPSLRSLMIRGSMWTFFGYGSQQVIRLGTNLVLARLLFPDVFGVMALVNVFLQGLQMFTDLGIGLSIIQNPRGEEPAFLRVAWTVQAIRGLAIFAFSLALAWPLARFYDEPQMVYYVPVACFTAVLGGFNSTSLFLLNKRLHIGAVTLIDLISQVVGTITMIAVAYMWPSVWSLLVGSVLSASATLVASHLVMPSLPMRVEWHRDISRELFHFGKWIFLATVLTFIVGRADRLILGKVISKSELGVYSIAVLLNGAVCDALQRLSSKVLFPVYSQLVASGTQRLRRQMLRIRLFLTVGILPPYYILTLWGAQIVALLYKEPYHDAGWMLQVLAAGSSFSIINTTISPILLSVGNSFRHMLLLAYQSAVLLIAMFIGGYYFGIKGFVVAISVCHITTYPVLVFAVRKYGAWLPALDFAAFAVSAAVCAIAFLT